MGDYWKNMMNDQPMPEVIKDLIQVPHLSDAGKDHFTRDFDINPNNITGYHTHVVSEKQEQKAIDQKFEPLSRK
ncbi:Organ specific protein [Sesbania bispinosa]|nr:Organ specific protein [Sesbania bispinosa]